MRSTSDSKEATKQMRDKLSSTLLRLRSDGKNGNDLVPAFLQETMDNPDKDRHGYSNKPPYEQLENPPERRPRHAYTAAEDEALLQGYAMHGFQWTLIQQDKRLNLGHRKATHLRDRFRTKFPQVYRNGVYGWENVWSKGSGDHSKKSPPADKVESKDNSDRAHPASGAGPGSIDSTIPPPPQSSLPSAVDATSTVWEHNNLPPLVWDELS